MGRKPKISDTEAFSTEWLKESIKSIRTEFENKKTLNEQQEAAIINIAEILLIRLEEYDHEMIEQINEKLIESEPGYMEKTIEEIEEDDPI